ncbi:MAG: IS4 family transposase, partial [Mariprofundaceae bacterium]|nr:IS4 family transposase [Mariprofundaceae bacterium]
YVLVAIIKKRLNLDASLYTILQILSVTLFERMTLYPALTDQVLTTEDCDMRKQLNLFGKTSGQ